MQKEEKFMFLIQIQMKLLQQTPQEKTRMMFYQA